MYILLVTYVEKLLVFLQLFLQGLNLLPEVTGLRLLGMLQLNDSVLLFLQLVFQLLHLLQQVGVLLLCLPLNFHLFLHQLLSFLQQVCATL